MTGAFLQMLNIESDDTIFKSLGYTLWFCHKVVSIDDKNKEYVLIININIRSIYSLFLAEK